MIKKSIIRMLQALRKKIKQPWTMDYGLNGGDEIG